MTGGMVFNPTEDQRRTVKALSGYGVPQDGIAIHIGVDPKTLRKYFRDELDRGSVEATAKVAQTLFHLATVERNVPSVIFWMKARAGWREKHEIEFSARTAREAADADLMRIIEHSGGLFDTGAADPVTRGAMAPITAGPALVSHAAGRAPLDASWEAAAEGSSDVI
jgi:hypothetical protein